MTLRTILTDKKLSCSGLTRASMFQPIAVEMDPRVKPEGDGAGTALSPYPPSEQAGDSDPHGDQRDQAAALQRAWPGQLFIDARAAVGHHGRRNQAQRQPHQSGHHDRVVDEAEDEKEVWNKIDRADRISRRGDGERLGVPRRARIAPCQREREAVALEPPRPADEPPDQDGGGSVTLPSASIVQNGLRATSQRWPSGSVK